MSGSPVARSLRPRPSGRGGRHLSQHLRVVQDTLAALRMTSALTSAGCPLTMRSRMMSYCLGWRNTSRRYIGFVRVCISGGFILRTARSPFEWRQPRHVRGLAAGGCRWVMLTSRSSLRIIVWCRGTGAPGVHRGDPAVDPVDDVVRGESIVEAIHAWRRRTILSYGPSTRTCIRDSCDRRAVRDDDERRGAPLR
jgi:hypothetical protein